MVMFNSKFAMFTNDDGKKIIIRTDRIKFAVESGRYTRIDFVGEPDSIFVKQNITQVLTMISEKGRDFD